MLTEFHLKNVGLLLDNSLDKVHRKRVRVPARGGAGFESRGQLIFDFQNFLVLALAQVIRGKMFLVQFDEERAW